MTTKSQIIAAGKARRTPKPLDPNPECLCIQPTALSRGYACPTHASENSGYYWLYGPHADKIFNGPHGKTQQKLAHQASIDYLEDFR